MIIGFRDTDASIVPLAGNNTPFIMLGQLWSGSKKHKSMVNRALHLNESAPLSLKGPSPPQQSDASEEDEDLKLLLTPSSSAEELRLITARVTHARSTAKNTTKILSLQLSVT